MNGKMCKISQLLINFRAMCMNLPIQSHMYIWKIYSNKIVFSSKVGHFTQMVFDRVIRIGCGYSQYEKPSEQNSNAKYNTLLVCNYAGSHVQDYRVYKIGNTASECKTGTNPDYPNLCDVTEDINYKAID